MPPLSLLLLVSLLALTSSFAPFAPLLSSPLLKPLHAEQAKVVVVTGASRGLGAAIARSMATDGCSVIVNYAGSEAKALEVVEDCKRLGGDAIAVQANCGVPEEIEAMLKKGVEKFGTVDVIVNNAGITKDGLVSEEQWHREEQWHMLSDT